MGDINSSHCYDLCDVQFACCDGAGGVSLTNITTINGAPPEGGFPTSPGAPFTSVQFNNNGTFGGSPQLTWDGNALHVASGLYGGFPLYVSDSGMGYSGARFDVADGDSLDIFQTSNVYPVPDFSNPPAQVNTAYIRSISPIELTSTLSSIMLTPQSATAGSVFVEATGVGLGINKSAFYPLDVNGNVNSTGCYLINGVPFACSDGAGGIIIENVTTINGNPPGGGGGGTPAPPDRAVQFNNGGAFGGTFNLVYSTTGNLGIGTSNPEVSVHANGGILSMNSPTTWPDSGPGIMMFVDPSNNGANGSAIYSYNFGPNTAIDLGIYARNLIGNVTTSSFSGRMGIGKAPGASFALDVNGNVTCNHCYYILDIPWACLDSAGTGVDLTNINSINGTAPGGGGSSQTPWLSDIDGANFALTNVQYINANQNISAEEFDIYGIPFAEAGIGPGEVQLINISLINGNPYPPPPTPQTPWLSNIDGANHTLQNVSALGIGTTAQTNIPLKVSGSPGGILARFQNTASTSSTQLVLYNDTGDGAGTFTAFGSSSVIFPNCAALNMGANTPAFLILMNSAEVFRVTNLPNRFIGIKQNNPAYQLDVTGDVNVTGVYRINGVPLSTGGGFWVGGSAGAIYYNGGNVGIGTGTPDRILTINDPRTSPASQLKILGNQSGNLSGISLLSYATSNNNITLGAEFSGSGWVALDTNAINIHQTSFGFAIDTASGLTVGGPITFSNALAITYDNKVGIGTTAPTYPLDVTGATAFTARFANTSATAASGFQLTNGSGNVTISVGVGGFSNSNSLFRGNAFFDYGSGSRIIFSQAGAQKMRLENSGVVGIGASAFGNAAVSMTGFPPVLFAVGPDSSVNTGGTIQLSQGNRGNEVPIVFGNSLTCLSYNNSYSRVLLGFNFAIPATNSGFSYITPAGVSGYSGVEIGGAIVFYCTGGATTAGGTVSPTALAVINTSGLGIGLGVGSPTRLLDLGADSAGKPGTNTWTVTSDIRTKQNVQRFESDWDIINALDPIVAEYNGYANTPYGTRVVGFAAQELQGILPQCVTAALTKMDDGSEENILGVNTHEIFFHMLRAIQDLNRRLARFENL